MPLHVTEVNLTDFGGAFSLIYSIQKNLYNRGFDDVVFDYFSMGKFQNPGNISDIEKMGGKIFSADLRRNRLLGFLKTPRLFYRYCKDNNVQTVHIHSDSAYILQIYSIPAKLAGVKHIIAHSHCANMNGDYRRLKRGVHFAVRPFICFSANKYLSCSDLATRWMYVGKLKKQAFFLKNGVNTKTFLFDSEKRSSIRKEYQIDNETVALVTVGDFSFQKNPFFLCDVMKQLSGKYKLFFIGDGPCRTEVEKYVYENRLQKKIEFVGRQNVSDFLNAMDIFLMPSNFEGLPVSGVEAQANGLPCIFSTKVTRQVKILDSTIFVNIDSADGWARSIQSLATENESRIIGTNKVKRAGFDIMDVSDNLYKIYRSMK